MLYGEALDRTVRNSTQRNRWDGRKEEVIVRWGEKWYVDSGIQSSRVYEDDDDECDEK